MECSPPATLEHGDEVRLCVAGEGNNRFTAFVLPADSLGRYDIEIDRAGPSSSGPEAVSAWEVVLQSTNNVVGPQELDPGRYQVQARVNNGTNDEGIHNPDVHLVAPEIAVTPR